MGPARRIAIGLTTLLIAAGGFAAGRVLLRPTRDVTQPIVFNHAKHVELMTCETCHQYYAERQHSGLPMLSTCMMCHEEPQTDSAEEEKVRRLEEAGEENVFRKLFRLADHVFYSHRRHVTVAGLECATCHGAIAQTERPPERPLVSLDMDFCIACHRREGVPSNCTSCHR